MSFIYNNLKLSDNFDKLFFPINKNYKNDVSYKSTFGIGQNQMNVYVDETNNTFIEICLPGYSKSDINITTTKTTLRISSETKDDENTQKGRNYIQQNFQRIPFEKVWSFPSGFNLENVDASYDAGILTLKIPQEKRTETIRNIKIS